MLLGFCHTDFTRKIAWSRLGCIASISQDSTRVNVRHLQCQQSDGKWLLSDETPLNQVSEVHAGHALVHLCWNDSGTELAVADSSGRVSIYSIPIALNSVNVTRQAAFDPDDDGAQIVGMMWLSQYRSVNMPLRALRIFAG
jgi:mediator of RNA polymerase II transcription subunit 16